MSKEHKDRLAEVVEAAFDGGEAGIVDQRDQSKLTQFRKMAKAFRHVGPEVPPTLVDQAKAIFPKRQRQILGIRIVGTTLGLSGARLKSNHETQVSLDAEGTALRLMYTLTKSGVEILGVIQGDGWTLECSGQEVECDREGKFGLTVADTGRTGMTFVSSEAEIRVPSFEQLVKRGPELDFKG